MAQWGTIDYYIDRLCSPTPPLHIDVCDSNLTDDDAFRLADALMLDNTTHENSNDIKVGNGCVRRSSSSGTTLKKLRLRGSQITARGFLALAEAIGGISGSTPDLEELDLGHTIDIANDVDDFAFGMYLLLSAATNLKHVDLEGCHLGRAAGMALGDALVSNVHNDSLETLNLRNNALEDDATIFLSNKIGQYCKSLRRIDLGLNYIGPRAADAMAELIESNPSSLHHLILFGNSIGDSGAMHFAKALKYNSNLMELNLGYNRISSVGMKALLFAIYDTSSLNTLLDSNHTLCTLLQGRHCINDLLRRGCDMDMLFDIDNILQLNEMNTLMKSYSSSGPSSNKNTNDSNRIMPVWVSNMPLSNLTIEQVKVVIYLTKCFDMRHFLAMERTMIPQALEFVAANLGCEKVFQLVGHWNMPQLFVPNESSRQMQACQ